MSGTEEYLAIDTDDSIHNEHIDNEIGCICCGSLMIEEGYKARLCRECRNVLSKRKIPVFIKIATIIILIIMVFSLVKLPNYVSQGVTLKKAEKAVASNNYFTAMKNYEELRELYPKNKKILVDLAEVYYQNNYISEMDSIYDVLGNVEMSTSLVERLDSITDKINRYYYLSDELYSKLEGVEESNVQDSIKIIEEHLKNNTNDISARYYLAFYYYDESRFMEAEDQLEELFKIDSNVYLAEDLLCDVYFSQKKYDEILELTEKILNRNPESVDAKIQVAKIKLKEKNNLDAYKIAEEAYKLDNQNLKSTLFFALVSHYNGLIKERDDLFNTCLEYEYLDEEEIKYYKDIFSGSINWQE